MDSKDSNWNTLSCCSFETEYSSSDSGCCGFRDHSLTAAVMSSFTLLASVNREDDLRELKNVDATSSKVVVFPILFTPRLRDICSRADSASAGIGFGPSGPFGGYG